MTGGHVPGALVSRAVLGTAEVAVEPVRRRLDESEPSANPAVLAARALLRAPALHLGK